MGELSTALATGSFIPIKPVVVFPHLNVMYTYLINNDQQTCFLFVTSTGVFRGQYDNVTVNITQ